LRHRRDQIGTLSFLVAARAQCATIAPLIERQGLTLIGVTVTNLDNELPRQLCLPLDPDNGELLDAALDWIRTRYGPTAITRGILLGRRTAPDMPMLPD
jgi:DNA polymerase-4